jgi:polysaccharide export outer membrane protein
MLVGVALAQQPMTAVPGATATQQPTNSIVVSGSKLIVSPGDQLQIQNFENPELSGPARVSDRGDVILPLIGSVHVAGLNVAQIGELLQQRYVEGDFLKRPQISVGVTEYVSLGITVSGAVKSPGIYPVTAPRMLHDVLTIAGGVDPKASTEIIITHKGDLTHAQTVHYNPTLHVPEIPAVEIQPGDTVVVPLAGVIYILGNVKSPGVYILEGRKTLTMEQGLALAGWGGSGAAMNRVRLFRDREEGGREEIRASAQKISKGQAADIALKDGDIIFVPTSVPKLAGERALEIAISLGTGYAVYHTQY